MSSRPILQAIYILDCLPVVPSQFDNCTLYCGLNTPVKTGHIIGDRRVRLIVYLEPMDLR